MNSESDSFAPGQTIADRFVVERTLGSGGAGIVFAARDSQSGMRVALKLLWPVEGEGDTLRKRFHREAAIAARITSPHVAKLIAYGELSDQTPYLAMEYVDGANLGVLLRQHGRFPIATVAGFALHACHALAEAHSLGIVHRDLKPENLMVTQDDQQRSVLKVLDFGASKELDQNKTALTKTGTSIGSPFYMSPEQFRSNHEVDARSDIWSLGVVLFQLLTGSHPFPAKTPMALVIRVERGAPLKLSTLRPEAPIELGQVLERCLQKMKEQRYGSIGELQAALVPFLSVPNT